VGGLHGGNRLSSLGGGVLVLGRHVERLEVAGAERDCRCGYLRFGPNNRFNDSGLAIQAQRGMCSLVCGIKIGWLGQLATYFCVFVCFGFCFQQQRGSHWEHCGRSFRSRICSNGSCRSLRESSKRCRSKSYCSRISVTKLSATGDAATEALYKPRITVPLVSVLWRIIRPTKNRHGGARVSAGGRTSLNVLSFPSVPFLFFPLHTNPLATGRQNPGGFLGAS
jgi:hypothetical protein